MISMVDVQVMNKEKLRSPQALLNVQQLAKYYMDDFELRNAYNLAKLLEKSLLLDKKDFLTQEDIAYKKLITRLKFFALNLCRDNEVLDIFQNSIADSLGISIINIKDRIDAFMLDIPVPERDVTKRKLRERLFLNSQILSTQPVTVEGRKHSPTIAHWLEEYIKHVGAGEVSNIKVADFKTNNKNFRLLSEAEKNKVMNLVEVFNHLNLSSQTIEGYEEPILFSVSTGEIFSLSKGIMEHVAGGGDTMSLSHSEVITQKIVVPQRALGSQAFPAFPKESFPPSMESDQPPKVQREIDDIINAYQGDPIFQRNVLEYEGKIKAVVKDNTDLLREEFYKAVQDQSKEQTCAVLKLLAQRNDLDSFLSQDQKLMKFITSTWPNVYGKKETNMFALDPRSRHSLQMFVKYILQVRLKMDENDAAHVGVQISNIYKKAGKTDYANLAYFDMQQKKFKWME